MLIANPIIWKVRKNRYFNSEQLQWLRAQVASVVAEHNDVVNYVAEIRDQGAFELGASSTGQYAHLANLENTSAWNNRRDRNVAEYAPHVHNASLQVVRNASMEPIKYLMKYFEIKANQETLADVQRVAEDISRLEEAVGNVQRRESEIVAMINPPAFILKRYADEFWSLVGVHLSPITVPYPNYKFQYTSAGGNSSQTVDINLDTPTLDALSETLVQKVRRAEVCRGPARPHDRSSARVDQGARPPHLSEPVVRHLGRRGAAPAARSRPPRPRVQGRPQRAREPPDALLALQPHQGREVARVTAPAANTQHPSHEHLTEAIPLARQVLAKDVVGSLRKGMKKAPPPQCFSGSRGLRVGGDGGI